MNIIRMMVLISLGMVGFAGCIPHTTGETEVGVRTIKLGVFKLGVKSLARPKTE